MKMAANKLPIACIVLGLLFLVTYAVLNWVLIPLFSGDQVVQGMRQAYGPFGGVDHWKNFGLPTFLALDPPLLFIYMFNVTNPYEIVRDGMKPILTQVGPYVYTIEKIIDALPAENNETLSFTERDIYRFSPMHSGALREEDRLTVLNIPFLKMVDALEKTPRQNSLFASLALAGEGQETVFVHRPVKELLFEGYSQPSLEKANKFLGGYAELLHGGKYGFFQKKNLTASKIYKISKTLLPQPNLDYAQILSYDGQPELKYWAKTEDNKCNQIHGTPDGTLFKPLRLQGLSLSVFKHEICRSLNFHLNGHVEQYQGLLGYRFTLGKELLLDSSVNFENNCFCPNPGVEIHTCVQGGTLSNCREDGISFVTTLPHFLETAGKPFLTQIVGLSPNPSLHESYIDLEPITGLALKSSIKLQTNYELSPTAAHDDLKSVPKLLFPLYWTKEVKSMNFIIKNVISENIMGPLAIMEICKWAVLGTGVLLLLLGLIILILRKRNKKYPIYFNTMMMTRESSLSVKSLPVPGTQSGGTPKIRKVSFKTGTKLSASADQVYSSGSDAQELKPLKKNKKGKKNKNQEEKSQELNGVETPI